MSVEPIKSEVRQLLAQADEKLRRAQHLHSQGSESEKVTAAGRQRANGSRKTGCC